MMTVPLHRVFAGTLAALLLLAGTAVAGPGKIATPQTDDGAPDYSQAANPFAGSREVASEGRTLFNVHCSHCHGPNAMQGERKRDLRRLKRRYRADMPAVYLKTTWNGRPDKGMPPWKEVVEEEELWKIYTFLETVQKK